MATRKTSSPDTLLLTGLPRSGTTLACVLLNECPDTLALPEPLRLDRNGDRSRAINEIEAFIAETRQRVLTRREAVATLVGGEIRDNFADPPEEGGVLRPSRAVRGTIRIERTLPDDFRLVIKHPAEFSALSDLLLDRYPLFALVRHPLAVLASWQTVNMPVNQGRLPMAETFRPELARHLEARSDVLDRQVALIGWLLRTYTAFPAGHVFRYEDMIADPGGQLRRFSPQAVTALKRPLTAHAPARRYPGVPLGPLFKALRAIRDEIEVFYPDFFTSTADSFIDGPCLPRDPA